MSLIQEFKEFAIKGNVIDLAVGVITGLGSEGYLLALEYLLSKINTD